MIIVTKNQYAYLKKKLRIKDMRYFTSETEYPLTIEDIQEHYGCKYRRAYQIAEILAVKKLGVKSQGNWIFKKEALEYIDNNMRRKHDSGK